MDEGGVKGADDLRPATAYRLPDALRPELAAPFGPVVQTDALPALLEGATVAAVGDVVSLALKRLGILPKLFVCDHRTERQEPDPLYERELGAWGDRQVRVRNPPGLVTRKAWDAVRAAFAREGTTGIVVDGEEDLLGIPVFLECPLGARVLYGAPGRGVVAVTVDAAFRRRAEALVARLEPAGA